MDSKQHKISERAYHKFLMRGGEHGHALADWIEAEKEIEAEAKVKVKSKSKSVPKKTKAAATTTRKKTAKK
jgi:hypothetical protein